MDLGSWEFEVCGTVSCKTAGVRFFVLKTAILTMARDSDLPGNEPLTRTRRLLRLP